MSRLLLTGSLVVLMSMSALAAEEKDKPDEAPKANWWGSSAAEPATPVDAQRAKKPPVRIPNMVPAHQPPRVQPRPQTLDPYATRPQLTIRPAPPVKQQQVIYRVKHLPATDLSQAINEVLRAQQAGTPGRSSVVIVPEVITNSLVISGAAEAVESAIELAEQLDIQPKMVQIRTLLVEIHASDDTQGIGGLLKRLSDPEADEDLDDIAAAIAELPGLRLLGGPQLTVLDNQPGFLQVGQRVPRVSGSSSTSRGQVNTIQMENVGLILAVTARINDDGLVTMEIDLEKSQLGSAGEGTVIATPEEGDPIRATQVETLTCQATIAVRDGQVMVLGGLASRESEMVILISPRIVEP